MIGIERASEIDDTEQQCHNRQTANGELSESLPARRLHCVTRTMAVDLIVTDRNPAGSAA
jgi:hypothetical protein